MRGRAIKEHNTFGVRTNGIDLVQVVAGDGMLVGGAVLNEVDGVVLLLQKKLKSVELNTYDKNSKHPQVPKFQMLFTDVDSIDKVIGQLESMRDILVTLKNNQTL